jgi:GR25 family glycosyltransferase involved in LPS biosynthesis
MNIKKIYYINLEKDNNRRLCIEKNIKSLLPLIPFERIEAISKLDIKNFENFTLKRLAKSWLPVSGVYPKPGGIGCYLSHYEARLKISNEIKTSINDSDYYMVLEDDCIFGDDFLSLISDEGFYKNIPLDAKILKPVSRKFDETHRVNEFFYDVSKSKELDYNYYFGTHMLIYRALNFQETCSELDQLPIFDIDWLINKKLEGIYAFGKESSSFVMQTNEGGSNTFEGKIN